jgi:predicted DNA-binding protein (MmcQ/YjbR family)
VKERTMPKGDADPLVEYCRNLPGATEDVKWGNDLVFSVGGKMFAAFGLPDREPIGFKVDPALFPILTERPGVVPAPYLAHHFWVNVKTREALTTEELEELLWESYRLVAGKLSKKMRASLGIEG